MGDRSGSDEEVMRANELSGLGKLSPQTCVHARNHQVEGQGRDVRQQGFDEAFALQAPLRRSGAMNAHQQLGGRDAGQRDWLVGNKRGQLL